MAERITRPPTKLAGGFPDGSLCGITPVEARHWTRWDDEPEPRYALVKYGREAIEHKDDTGADVATLKILEFEPLPDTDAAAQQIQELRAERVGELQFPSTTDPDWDELKQLRAARDQWQNTHDVSGVDLGRRWVEIMGDGDPAGPNTTNITRLREFLLTVGVFTDPPREPPPARFSGG